MLIEIEGKVYRRIKEKELHSCTGCVADSEYTDNSTSLCTAIQKSYDGFICDRRNSTTGETGFIFEEVVEFNSHRELWEWLLVGNKVKYSPSLDHTLEDRVVFLEDDVLYAITGGIKTKYHLNLYSMYAPVIATPEWYDNIPEQGILCWVHDYHKDRKDNISLIKEYDPTREDKFINFRSEARIVSFYFATPLTQEELLERCYER